MSEIEPTRWQPSDRAEGERPQDQGTVESHEGHRLIIRCEDGCPLYTSQETAEELGWKRTKKRSLGAHSRSDSP